MQTRSQGPPEPIPELGQARRSRRDSHSRRLSPQSPKFAPETPIRPRQQPRSRSVPRNRKTAATPLVSPSTPLKLPGQLFASAATVVVPPIPPYQDMAHHDRITFPKFSGSSNEDPDAFLRQFDVAYAVNYPNPPSPQHKPHIFESCMRKKAAAWLAADHGWADWDRAKAAFANRFQPDRTDAQKLERLRNLKQRGKSVQAYTAKFRVLHSRLAQFHPQQEMVNTFYVQGLSKPIRKALATDDLATGSIDTYYQKALRLELFMSKEKSSKSRKSAKSDSKEAKYSSESDSE